MFTTIFIYHIQCPNEILLKLKGFHYSMSLDLNMAYYHIQIIKNTSNSCEIILP